MQVFNRDFDVLRLLGLDKRLTVFLKGFMEPGLFAFAVGGDAAFFSAAVCFSTGAEIARTSFSCSIFLGDQITPTPLRLALWFPVMLTFHCNTNLSSRTKSPPCGAPVWLHSV